MEKPTNNDSGTMTLFSKHGLAGLVIGAQFALIFYMMAMFNSTLGEHTAVMRELKVLIQTLVK